MENREAEEGSPESFSFSKRTAADLSPVETPAQDLLFVYGNEQPQESLPTNKKIVRSHAMKSSWRTRKQSESNLALMKRAITPLLAPKTLTDQHTYGSESSTVLSTSGASSCQAI